ncbi:MATE family efflux transporter [Chungangia koreensis]|uniref:Probable multidrug resistance protein NorM n=1 Tax=Chungangia koreensis TaxID=752657 RepID=A0ABV8X862_9LACT
MKNKWSKMISIIFPILITQVAMNLISFFDVFMSSRYGTDDLAGVSIGSSIWLPVYTGLAGILLSVSPLVAQLSGAKNKKEVRFTVQQGIYVAIGLALIVFILLQLISHAFLVRMDLEPAVIRIASEYLFSMSFGLFPLFIYSTIRSYIDALGMTRVTMFITLMSAPINVLFNYLFIFGKFGFPELGGVGAGVASAITYWLILGISLWILRTMPTFSEYQILNGWSKVSFGKMKEIITLGIPIGISILAEVSIFSAVTLMMGKYGTEIISAHQIAMNFTSLLYMVPLSVSMGATILVGHEVGAKRYHDAKQYSWMGVTAAVVFSFFSIAILLLFRGQIASLYSSDQAVVSLAIQFFVFAALFQLSDAIQAPVQGALRGYKDVNVTFIMAIISYWIIGLPTGYLLSEYTDLGPFGYWIGLITGLTIGAATLSGRLLRLQAKRKSNDSVQA